MRKVLVAVLLLTAACGNTLQKAPERPLGLSGCHVRIYQGKELPDPNCTPGATNKSLTVADLCPHLHSTVVRNVPTSVKNQVRNSYRDTNPGEIDHLISLELGGANSPDNLWPEDGKIPNPKDRVEDAAHKAVCSGKIDLADAQHSISTNWVDLGIRLGVRPG